MGVEAGCAVLAGRSKRGEVCLEIDRPIAFACAIVISPSPYCWKMTRRRFLPTNSPVARACAPVILPERYEEAEGERPTGQNGSPQDSQTERAHALLGFLRAHEADPPKFFRAADFAARWS